MANEHARRTQDGEAEAPRREPERPQPRFSRAAGMALGLQQAAGNQAVARLLARTPRTLAREDYLSMVDKKPVGTGETLQKAVEATIEDHLGGVEALWQQNDQATSPEAWAEMVHSFMGDRYDLGGLHSEDLIPVIQDLKDERREELLLRLVNNAVYFAGETPYSAENLVELLIKRRAFLEVEVTNTGELKGADGPALTAIFNTEGATAVDGVEFDESKNEQMLDQDGVVVILDSHQQKHQHPNARIAKFGTYRGEPGSRFAKSKDLEWHRTNTAVRVKEKVLEAVSQRKVTKNGAVYAPPKVADGGIVYDLGISWDNSAQRWVGSYHCNPLKTET